MKQEAGIAVSHKHDGKQWILQIRIHEGKHESFYTLPWPPDLSFNTCEGLRKRLYALLTLEHEARIASLDSMLEEVLAEDEDWDKPDASVECGSGNSEHVDDAAHYLGGGIPLDR